MSTVLRCSKFDLDNGKKVDIIEFTISTDYLTMKLVALHYYINMLVNIINQLC